VGIWSCGGARPCLGAQRLRLAERREERQGRADRGAWQSRAYLRDGFARVDGLHRDGAPEWPRRLWRLGTVSQRGGHLGERIGWRSLRDLLLQGRRRGRVRLGVLAKAVAHVVLRLAELAELDIGDVRPTGGARGQNRSSRGAAGEFQRGRHLHGQERDHMEGQIRDGKEMVAVQKAMRPHPSDGEAVKFPATMEIGRSLEAEEDSPLEEISDVSSDSAKKTSVSKKIGV